MQGDNILIFLQQKMITLHMKGMMVVQPTLDHFPPSPRDLDITQLESKTGLKINI
jgi:hypothetical protein